ncbi:hypothetical protein A19Y_2966 [Planktothrix agardhii NIVA-CYA 126/8]|uniref:Uncharacterized protein n=1 Tax=Planktothrix agardhii (strain NIVA-CYA 126/8) TaxID=388467 RepID=A0A073CHR4_PLAA1|nr:hypothetical protein A19Y_2966 [Planktothrix agardhii NIVA-CYA 126/8]
MHGGFGGAVPCSLLAPRARGVWGGCSLFPVSPQGTGGLGGCSLLAPRARGVWGAVPC